ncbi:MAG: VWA domain-containing protein [Candidatus Sulfopaludibacter sp.]|nr:VWA domain-containing protein [Candidatus Sulfopaludibacter sp.]
MSKSIGSCFFIVTLFSLHAANDDGGPLAARLTGAGSIAANIRVDVNLTLVPVSVTDLVGRSVRGLRPQNFQVYDGLRPMPIVSFSSQDQRIAVGLIFDCSSSMAEKYKTSREAPRELFQQLNSEDQSFLVTVSDKAELKWPLTSDFDRLQNALVFTHPQGTTSLIDGIYLGLREMKKSHNPRKALVVVSDGGDNNSRYSMRDLGRLVVESDVMIFAVGLYDNPQSSEEEMGPALLSRLTNRTGGANFEVHNVEELRIAMGRIGVALHNQYVLGYYPPAAPADGTYRKIKVELVVPKGTPPLLVHARAGYYSPKQ